MNGMIVLIVLIAVAALFLGIRNANRPRSRFARPGSDDGAFVGGWHFLSLGDGGSIDGGHDAGHDGGDCGGGDGGGDGGCA